MGFRFVADAESVSWSEDMFGVEFGEVYRSVSWFEPRFGFGVSMSKSWSGMLSRSWCWSRSQSRSWWFSGVIR